MIFDKIIYIGNNEIFFLGRIDSLLVHSHKTWTLCICLDGQFQFKTNSYNQIIHPSNTILIPPNLKHELTSNSSLVIIIFFEKYSNFLSNVNLSFPITFLKGDIFKNIYLDFLNMKSYDKNDWKRLIENHLKLLNLKVRNKIEIDSRIFIILKVLNSDLDENQYTISRLSSLVNLSESRLSHLFKIQIGLPISSYRIWLKLKQLGKSLESGKNLTFAAQESGFFDSSHFNRVFKKYFGLNPKKVFLNSKILWIHSSEI